MRILVTGGAGFLGSHLCERLVRDGHDVICLDNNITGKASNVAHLMGKSFTFIEYDVTNYLHVSGPLDAVLHFASPASPIDYIRLPIQTLKVGSLGTHKALGLAKSKGARFILASTSEVYGDPLVHPQSEDYWGNVNPIGPRGVYDEAKRFSEAMTMAYRSAHNVNTGIVRIFNTYGPRMRIEDGRVVPNFITQAICGNSLTVYGDGQQTRSFCYVDDLIEGIVRFMHTGQPGPVNIGNPREMTVLQFAEIIREAVNPNVKITFKGLPMDDPKTRCPNISLAHEILGGWEPVVPLEQGIKPTIDYFRQAMDAYK